MTQLKLPECPRILIVRRDNIGDMVCTTPMLRTLRESFPAAAIGVLANVYNAPILENNPDVDDLFVYQKLKHIKKLTTKIRAAFEQMILRYRIKRWGADLAILANAGYDRHGLKYLRSVGIKTVIGYRTDDHLPQPDIALTPESFEAQHEVMFLSDLLKPLGVESMPGPMRLYPDHLSLGKARAVLPNKGLKLAMHISARDPERQWGADNWVMLSSELLRAYPDLEIVMLWSPGQCDSAYVNGDDLLAEMIKERTSHNRLCAYPVENIRSLISVISLCDGFIGADGGAMHIAAALQKPMIVFFEDTPRKWRHWSPWQAKSQIIRSPTPEIASIPLDAVIEHLPKLIEQMIHEHARR